MAKKKLKKKLFLSRIYTVESSTSFHPMKIRYDGIGVDSMESCRTGLTNFKTTSLASGKGM